MWRQIVSTVVVGTALFAVGAGAEALAEQVNLARAQSGIDDVSRAAEMTGLTEAEVRSLRENGVAWSLIRQAADIVAAEGLTIDQALDRLREDKFLRSDSFTSGQEDGRATGERDRGRNSSAGETGQAERIAAATGLSVVELSEFQRTSGLAWPEVRQIASLAVRDAISLEQAAVEVNSRANG